MVISQNAEVRSGPGREYYATQPIAAREQVQVFGAQAGWLAIRPPEGSFSWLRADDLRFQPAADANSGLSTALIRGSGVISQIGSQLTGDRDVWQIELKKDELVYVLGRDAEDPDWVKIAPPAGEFRWIRETDVRRMDPSDTYMEDREVPRSGTRDQNVTRGTNNWAGRTVAQQLEDINLKLTDAVSFAAGSEELQQLYDRAEDAWSRATDPQDLQAAKEIAGRIETFLLLAQRQEKLGRNISASSRSIATNAPTIRPSERGNAGVTQIAGRDAANSSQDPPTPGASEPRYDAAGILTPVSSGNASAPQYALLDEEGKLKFYLTAAPGMRLQAFEGHYIGVTGNRGFSPELNARHVTARQVHALDTPIRRELP